jgi:hypothetical protein
MVRKPVSRNRTGRRNKRLGHSYLVRTGNRRSPSARDPMPISVRTVAPRLPSKSSGWIERASVVAVLRTAFSLGEVKSASIIDGPADWTDQALGASAFTTEGKTKDASDRAYRCLQPVICDPSDGRTPIENFR